MARKEKPNLIKASIFNCFLDSRDDFIYAALADRSGDHARLAEPTSTGAPTRYLNRYPIVGNFNKWHDEIRDRRRKFSYDAFQHR
jgi:hypothetical protein